MKRLFLIPLILLLALPCEARMTTVVVAVGVGVAPSCTESNDELLWSPDTENGTTDSGANWAATKFTLAASKTITLYKIKTCELSANVGSSRAVVMNHDAVNDQPDETSEVANSAVSLAAANVTACGSGTVHSYVLASTYTLSAGTYWLVEQVVSGHERNIYYDASTGDRVCYSEDSGSSWNCGDDYMYDMEVWGCN